MKTLKNLNKKLLAENEMTMNHWFNNTRKSLDREESKHSNQQENKVDKNDKKSLEEAYAIDHQINSLVKSLNRAESIIEEKDKEISKHLNTNTIATLKDKIEENQELITNLQSENERIENELKWKIDQLKGVRDTDKKKSEGNQISNIIQKPFSD